MNYRQRKNSRRRAKPSSPIHLAPTLNNPTKWDRRFKFLGRLELLIGIFAIPIVAIVGWNELASLAEQRRVNAWQLVTSDSTGNSGKITALEHLNQNHYCVPWTMLCLQKREKLTNIHLGEETYLEGINLFNAELDEAVFSRVNLRHSNLAFAFLSGANLSTSELSFAHLKYAVLSDASLRNAVLIEADLRGANLAQTDLTGAILVGAKVGPMELGVACVSDPTWPPLLDAQLSSIEFPKCPKGRITHNTNK